MPVKPRFMSCKREKHVCGRYITRVCIHRMRNVVEYCVNISCEMIDKAWIYFSHDGGGVEDVASK